MACAAAPKTPPQIAISKAGLSLNRGAAGGAPSPAAIKAALGEPSRIVDRPPSQFWVYDELGVVVVFDPQAGSVDLVEVYFGDVPKGGVVPAKRFAGSVTIGKAAVSNKSSMDSSGHSVSDAGGVYESGNPGEGWNFSLGPLYVALGAPAVDGEEPADDEEPAEPSEQIEARSIKTLSIGFGFDDPAEAAEERQH